MCGIFAMRVAHTRAAHARVQAALHAMHSRGPDGSGTSTLDAGHVWLAHTRLAIMDPEGGAQPLSNEDGSVVAVVNGEIYGFEALRRALESRGHRFRTASDSEVLVHLYEERGVDAVRALRGELAFVLYDTRTHTLLAGRDRFGIKPLCYTVQGTDLFIASTLKALVAAGVPAAWDPHTFWQIAQCQYPLPSQTLCHNIHQLPPAHILIARQGEPPEIRRYWDFDYPLEPESVELGEAASLLRERFDEAVAERMRADVEVGCYVSGGLDSCSVVATAARLTTQPLRCFTLSFDESAYDELEIAREMVQHVGGELIPVRVDGRALLEAHPDAVRASEGLVINGHLSAKYLLSRAVRQAGIKVVLVGEGADEVLAGYPHLRRDLFRAARDTAAESTLAGRNAVARSIFLPDGGDALPLDAVERALGFVPTYLEAKAGLGRRMLSVLDPDFVEAHQHIDGYAELISSVDVEGQLRGRHPVHQSMVLWSRQSLAQYILPLIGDGTEMAHSVEGRLPFLEPRLVEQVVRWPVSLKISSEGIEKHVFREAMRDRLTPRVYRRQKHALLAPPLCFRPALRDLVRGQIEGAHRHPFLDAHRLLELLDRADRLSEAERQAWDPVLMMSLSAVAFHEGMSSWSTS